MLAFNSFSSDRSWCEHDNRHAGDGNRRVAAVSPPSRSPGCNYQTLINRMLPLVRKPMYHSFGMRSCWCISVIISVLFLSVDGAADSVIKGHAHAAGSAHQFDNGAGATPDNTSDTEANGDHCERCCHGHTAGITAQVAAIMTAFATGDNEPGRSPHVRNFAQAPPSPPPNA